MHSESFLNNLGQISTFIHLFFDIVLGEINGKYNLLKTLDFDDTETSKKIKITKLQELLVSTYELVHSTAYTKKLAK